MPPARASRPDVDRLTARARDVVPDLRSARRQRGLTCQVCTAPVPKGYARCYRCTRDARTWGDQLADRVAPLVYAVRGQQSGALMRDYKRPTGADPRHRAVVALLLYLAHQLHRPCLEHAAALPLTHHTVVASLPAKAGRHRLERVLPAMGDLEPLPVTALATTPDPRAVDPRHYTITRPLPAGSHVLLIEDTWTTGGHAQSLALAARAAGATQVSILTVARWLDPSHEPTGAFLRAEEPVYDPRACPWPTDVCHAHGRSTLG